MSDQDAAKINPGPKHQHSPAGIHQKSVKKKAGWSDQNKKETAQITLNIILHEVFS